MYLAFKKMEVPAWGPLDPKIWGGGGIWERVRFHNYNNQTNPLYILQNITFI